MKFNINKTVLALVIGTNTKKKKALLKKLKMKLKKKD